MQMGFFIVTSLEGEDAQGAATMARVKSKMNSGIKGTLYLPPYLRPNQCKIDVDSVVFGCLDEVTGRGAAMFGDADADYGYFMDANLQIKQNVTVNGDCSVDGNSDVGGDCKVSGKASVTGNVTAADCQTSSVTLNGLNTSFTAHMHVCAAPGATSGTPVFTPVTPTPDE